MAQMKEITDGIHACIKCPECGDLILLVPDVKAMKLAIQCHVAKHRKEMEQKLDDLETKLTEEVLELATQ